MSFAVASSGVGIQLEDAEQAGEVTLAAKVAAHGGLQEKEAENVRGFEALAGKPG